MHYALKGKYPIETKEQVKTAEQYFASNITKLDPADRAVAAFNIEKRASDLSFNLDSSWVTNYSRITKLSSQISPSFEANMRLRKEATQNRTIEMNGVAINADNALNKIAELKNEGADGRLLVTAIEEFDKVANLQYGYDTTVMDPIFTVYGDHEDCEYDSVKIASGMTNYDATKASRNEVVLTKIAEQLGSEAATEFKVRPLNTVLSASPIELSVIKGAMGV